MLLAEIEKVYPQVKDVRLETERLWDSWALRESSYTPPRNFTETCGILMPIDEMGISPYC
jgi:hypothetical protein